MRSRIVKRKEMHETFGTEVRDFPFAFVLPAHGARRETDGRAPAHPVHPLPPDASFPRRRAGDKRPTYIEIKPRPA